MESRQNSIYKDMAKFDIIVTEMNTLCNDLIHFLLSISPKLGITKFSYSIPTNPKYTLSLFSNPMHLNTTKLL